MVSLPPRSEAAAWRAPTPVIPSVSGPQARSVRVPVKRAEALGLPARGWPVLLTITRPK